AWVDAIDESALVGAGVEHAVAVGGETQDMLLARRIEYGRLALAVDAIDAAMRPSARVQCLPLGIDGQRPDVRLAGLAEHLRLSARVDADNLSARPCARIHAAVRRHGQAKHLTLFASIRHDRLTLRRHLINLPLVAGGDVQVAVAVLDDVPYV